MTRTPASFATEQDEGRPSWSEHDRLAALRRYEILDTPREPEFDDIVQLVAELFEAPIAVVNLLAEERQWFKAEVGLGVRETPLDVSICARAILSPGIFVIDDTTKDERFSCNPLVTQEPHLRFYAGAPLETPEGLPLGTLCVLDTKPRPQGITDRQRLTLEVLARQVMTQLELRRAVKQRDHEIARGRAGNERLATVLESVSDGFYALDADLRVVVFNAAAERYFERSREDVIGRSLLDVFPTIRGSAFEDLYRRVMESGEPERAELRSAVHPDRIAEVRVSRTGGGGLAIAFSDVTARKRAEHDLEAREAQLQAVFDTVPVGIVMAEAPTGQITTANAYAEELFGHPVLRSRDVAEYRHWNSSHADGRRVDGPEYPLSRVVKGEAERAEMEVLYHRADGRDVWVKLLAAAMRDASGRLIGGVVACLDIDRRKRMEERLASLAAVVEQSRDFIGIADRDGRPVFVNEAGLRMMGLPDLEAAQAEHFTHFFDDLDSHRIIDEALPACERDGYWESEVRFRRFDDGRTFPVLYSVFPVRDAEGRTQAYATITRDLTESQRIEAERRAFEERYRIAVRATNDAIWDWDLTSNNVLWNEAVESAYGHVLSEVGPTGEWWLAHIHPEDRARVDESIHSVMHGAGARWSEEYRFLRADGTYADVLDRGFVLRDEQGRAVRMIGAMLNLSERRRTEAKLRNLSRRLDAILSNTRMAVFLMDERQQCVYANAAAEQLTGYGYEQMQGRALHDVVHHKRPDGSYYPLDECPIDRAFPERAQMQGEELFVAPDGSFYPVAFTASPVLDEAAKPVGTVIEAREISQEVAERKRQEFRFELIDRLRASDEPRTIMATAVEMLGRHLGVSRVGYGLVREDGQTVDLETEYVHGVAPLAGTYPLDAFGTGNIRNLRAGRTSVYPDVEKDLDTAGIGLGDHAIASIVAVPLLKDDRLHAAIYINHEHPRDWAPEEVALVEEVASRVWDAVERARVSDELRELNRDLERRVSEEVAERAKAEEALRQAQKMEAVGQLTGGIAHDFNNLLTVVTGNIDMAGRALEAAGSPDPRARRALDNAMKGAERAASLTQRLLAFSRRQPLAPKPLDVDKLVLSMSDMLNRALGEMVKLEIVTTPGLWRVEVDPNQLESAILNLAVNARDAMPQGGDLTIETANARLDDSYVAHHAEVAPGHYTVIAVTDTGLGMSREVAARVFEPFYTTKEVGKGTGLGLSMVYGFVKQSGGHVKIYTEEGHGTTVKIYLPRLMSDDVSDDEATLTPGLEVSRYRESVLVVEDDDDVRAYTVECLRELGYRVLEAHDGPSALRLLERQEGPLDLLFTDVVMPGMSGRELADAARERQPNLKVIYTSGYTRDAIVHGGRLDPGVDLIAKPFTYQALAQKVRDVLDRGRTGRVLVVEADSTVRALAGEALSVAGYTIDEAANAGEMLAKVRSAQGKFDAILLDFGLPDRAGEALVAELRALHADLPILIASLDDPGEFRDRIAADRCMGLIEKPYTSARLQKALQDLGVTCARRGRK